MVLEPQRAVVVRADRVQVLRNFDCNRFAGSRARINERLIQRAHADQFWPRPFNDVLDENPILCS